MISALIDIPRQSLSLPAGCSLESLGGGLRRVIYDPDGDGQGPHGFFKVLSSNANRWIAWWCGPARGLQWLQNHLTDVEIYLVTPELVRDRRTQLENLGLTFDGAGRMLAPHTICGQNPWIEPAA